MARNTAKIIGSGALSLLSVAAMSTASPSPAHAVIQGCTQHSYWYVSVLPGSTKSSDAAGVATNKKGHTAGIKESWERTDTISGSITGDTGLTLDDGIAKVEASMHVSVTSSTTVTRGTIFEITVPAHGSVNYEAGIMTTHYLVSYRTIYNDCHVRAWSSGVVTGTKKYFDIW